MDSEPHTTIQTQPSDAAWRFPNPDVSHNDLPYLDVRWAPVQTFADIAQAQETRIRVSSEAVISRLSAGHLRHSPDYDQCVVESSTVHAIYRGDPFRER